MILNVTKNLTSALEESQNNDSVLYTSKYCAEYLTYTGQYKASFKVEKLREHWQRLNNEGE